MLKKILLITHRWFGITAGFYFALLGVTGSYLVYREPLQELFNRQVRASAGLEGEINLTAAVAAAQKGLGVDVLPSRIWISENKNRNLELSFSGLPGMGRGSILAFVDPVTNEFKGSENFRATFGGQMFIFHHDLFLGSLGRTIMAVAGSVMLFLLLGGLYLWWPRKISWRRALRLGPMNNSVQTQLELHKFFGFYSLVLMFMVTFSGVYISRPDWFQKITPRPPVPPAEKLESVNVDFNRFLQAARETGARPWILRFDAKKMLLQVLSGDGGEQRLNAQTFSSLAPEPPPNRDMRRIQRELHGGDFWGQAGEILVFISGLLPVFFYFSGFYIWWKKSKRRRVKANQVQYV